jgi:hypothetical protein
MSPGSTTHYNQRKCKILPNICQHMAQHRQFIDEHTYLIKKFKNMPKLPVG